MTRERSASGGVPEGKTYRSLERKQEMSMSKTMKLIATICAAMLAIYGLAAPASAHSADTAAAPAGVAASQAADTQLVADILAAQASLAPGERTLVTTVNGYGVYAQKDATGVTSVLASPEGINPGGGVHPLSICSNVVAAGVFALGAALLAAAALTGGLEIAGVFLSPFVLNMLAAAAGSYAAIETIIAAYVC